MTERPGSSPPAIPASVVRLAAGALPAEVLAVLAGPVGEAVAQAAGYVGRALSENTRRADVSDWRAFCSWCEAGDVAALPAAPVVIGGHLASLAATLGRSGLRRRLAAIAHHHRQAGHPWETRQPAISATMRGTLTTHGKPARRQPSPRPRSSACWRAAAPTWPGSATRRCCW
ncbi:hypothetical protein EAH89_24750 [Roseomonas nepalensis]|uniref:Integrase n=1 Tax=Muricoccus nepalensis TaxID=1854500 RepID=A0A502FAI2_9PROT|nr:hypothetical protein [Roseomonas nepalensis]TPG46425.1 hypothetical protein EAH89_24750 [Roseomonas nepalensis]